MINENIICHTTFYLSTYSFNYRNLDPSDWAER